MTAAFNHIPARLRGAAAAIAFAAATAAAAQNAAAPQPEPQRPSSAAALNLPQNLQLFGSAMPSVVKATAIVNGEVITQTDVDQRVALLLLSSEAQQVSAEELQVLRQQVLRNLIDEALQIQAARREEIKIDKQDVERTLARVAQSANQTPEQLGQFLQARGSSIKSLRRQIEGEIAWSRLQRRKIADFVSVGEDEVKALLDRMNAAKGTDEFRVGEIFISATPGNEAQALANANRILDQLRQGASFAAYARQFSEASTAAVGGDLGWVRPEQLPEPLAAALRQLRPGTISPPIQVQGGVSILAVQDVRKVLAADPRNAVLSLKQVAVTFPAGTTRERAEPVITRFAEAARNIGGCGGAERIAAQFNGEVTQRDEVKLRELPPVLQEMMLPMQVGQATRPFGTLEDGVRILVICGRDEVAPGAPSYDEVYNQLNEERVNIRARRYLRDLRRDAVIEFR